ncbi:DUF3817 domain-containing protein [Streptomyces sp. JJ38]|uniref:DUF3817 domain-containing protein n=1 Tax=Streptomyces sp. JJ38 TaxID=2738128 RepID=UPI001C564C38|nr:DUF3817 domain-containing protein [Streptomyces sp. JJ38]MBW1595828.1 DUF3817 domain-containing protein [Streptomyces sp. JJ38]
MDIKTASALRRLRLVSVVEAVSYLLLLLCSVLKRTTDFNAVPVMGPVHGVLVVLFLVFLADAWNRTKWQLGRPLVYFVLSVVPFGGFYADRMLRRECEEAVASGQDAAEPQREGVAGA